jgi:hypothetical protein
MAVYSTTVMPTGTHAITATYGGDDNFATSAHLLPVELAISRAPLTVTANSLSRPFGAANPTLTYTCTGFVNGEDASALTGSPVLTTTAALPSSIGTYPITITQGSLSAANYSFSFVDGTLTVLGVKFYLPLLWR